MPSGLGGLFAGRARIVPQHARGFYQRVRWATFSVLLAGFFALPWVRLGDRPAVWFDLPGRRFHLGPVTFGPQDLWLAALFAIGGAIALGLATAVLGRVWCGFACPQTVGTSLFLEVARLIEGDRNAQLKLAAAPWTAGKLGKRALKHGLWLAMASVLAFDALAFFVPMPELLKGVAAARLPLAAWLGWAGLTAFAYYDFGHFREQMCTGPCPYGRMQGVLLDRDSLVLSYDAARGEPRGKYRRNEPRPEGDCIDCKLCVVVCPAGIDIRQGPQYECISCMRCADACDGVMDRLGFDRGLIGVASERERASAREPAPASVPSRGDRGRQGDGARPAGPAAPRVLRTFLRPRPLVYTAILAAIGATLALDAGRHPTVRLDVALNRGLLARTLPDGRVADAYLVKAQNTGDRPGNWRLTIEGFGGQLLGTPQLSAPAGGLAVASVVVAMPAGSSPGPSTRPFRFVLTDLTTGRVLAAEPAIFWLPQAASRRGRT